MSARRASGRATPRGVGDAARALPRRQGRAARALRRGARRRARGRAAPGAGAGPPRRRDAARRCGSDAGMPRRRRAGRGRRLRPRRAVPALRRRRAGAAARPTPRRRPRRAAPAIEALHHRLLGHRPRDRLAACARSTSAWPRRRATSRCRPRCSSRASSCGSRTRVPAPSARATAQAMDPQRLPARQDARDAPAPPEVREHALLARAQLQGKPGRPARPADRDLGGARRRPRPDLAASSPPTA